MRKGNRSKEYFEPFELAMSDWRCPIGAINAIISPYGETHPTITASNSHCPGAGQNDPGIHFSTLDESGYGVRRRCWRWPWWAVYGQSLRTPFIFDDYRAIIANDSDRLPVAVDRRRCSSGTIEPTPVFIPTSARPLANLSLALDLCDGRTQNPTGYHLVNVILHWCSAMLLWAIVRRTLRMPYFNGEFDATADWLAAAVALVWAVYPRLWTGRLRDAADGTHDGAVLSGYALLQPSHGPLSACCAANVACNCDTGARSGHAVQGGDGPAPLIVLLFELTFVASRSAVPCGDLGRCTWDLLELGRDWSC